MSKSDMADPVNGRANELSTRPGIQQGEVDTGSALAAEQTIADFNAGWAGCLTAWREVATRQPEMTALALVAMAEAGFGIVANALREAPRHGPLEHAQRWFAIDSAVAGIANARELCAIAGLSELSDRLLPLQVDAIRARERV